ncbi:aurora kinase A-A-like [Tropilaelaps mercedesae]|uniref:Aurora kinase A-A-like n=1 Tax=Tropilaelaps mercedesae TaxID=418985 RepID=A0A1V9XJ76_9ACAR|nr:aurora kinase A-A-like [Tropilaelaps mercedesae]
MLANAKYDNRVDVWCLGVLLFELLTGAPPFKQKTDRLTFKAIASGVITYPTHMDPDAKNLISQLCSVDPEKRPSVDEIARHPWLEKYAPLDDSLTTSDLGSSI